VSNPATALVDAMRAALLARTPLAALLQGQHVYDEKPHGAVTSFVSFDQVETRDWSVKDQKAHEHFVTLAVETNGRSRKLAQDIVAEIEAALDNAALTLSGHRLINLRLVFWTVMRGRGRDTFAATLRFRAATEPL
jgi:hypothetical protein